MSTPADSRDELVLDDAGLNELELALGGLFVPDFPRAHVLVDVEHTAIANVAADGTLVPLRSLGHRPFPALRITRREQLEGASVTVITDDTPTADTIPVASDVLVVLDRGDHDRLGRSVRRARALHETVRVLPLSQRLDRTGIERVLSAAGAGTITWWATAREDRGGAVVMFTGLSGSGKSTVARAVADRLREIDDRTVTLLDGDEVRSMLSSGLGFSRADRERNVQRLAWVAALAARHGGIALCAPIAPYEEMRADARRIALDAGADFVLIHVDTPIEVCERRDRKGLYARARAGEIEHFTGISDPYEIPLEPDLTLDTSVRSLEECVETVITALARPTHPGPSKSSSRS